MARERRGRLLPEGTFVTRVIRANSISTSTYIDAPPAFGWDLIAWSTTEWVFLAVGVAAAAGVIGAAYYLARQEEQAERDTVEQEVREWVDAIIGELEEGRGRQSYALPLRRTGRWQPQKEKARAVRGP